MCLQQECVPSRTLFPFVVFSFPHRTHVFSYHSLHRENSYSAVNTWRKFPHLCKAIPPLLYHWSSFPCSLGNLSLLEELLSFHCNDLLKAFVICSDQWVSWARAGVQKCCINVWERIDRKEDNKKVEWLSRNLELKSLVSSPSCILYLLRAAISLREEKLIIYFHFQRLPFALFLTFGFLASY